MMEISVKHQTIVAASVLILGHCVIDNLMDLFGSIENVQKGLDNLLVVHNIRLRLNISWSFFDNFIQSVGKVGNDLDN